LILTVQVVDLKVLRCRCSRWCGNGIYYQHAGHSTHSTNSGDLRRCQRQLNQ